MTANDTTDTTQGNIEASVRLDRWLFAVRVYKSRSLAAKAITGGKIKVNGNTAKAHRPLHVGDEVVLKRDGKTLSYKVTGLIEKRVGAKEAVNNYQLEVDSDIPENMRDIMATFRELEKQVPRSKGRPTKRDRRLIDRLQGD